MAWTTLGQARQEGRVEGQRKMAQVLLASRFGPLSPLVEQRLEAMSEDQLRDLALAFPKAQSLQELGLAD